VRRRRVRNGEMDWAAMCERKFEERYDKQRLSYFKKIVNAPWGKRAQKDGSKKVKAGRREKVSWSNTTRGIRYIAAEIGVKQSPFYRAKAEVLEKCGFREPAEFFKGVQKVKDHAKQRRAAAKRRTVPTPPASTSSTPSPTRKKLKPNGPCAADTSVTHYFGRYCNSSNDTMRSDPSTSTLEPSKNFEEAFRPTDPKEESATKEEEE